MKSLAALARRNASTIVLAVILLVASVASLFVGVLDMDVSGLLAGDADHWRTLLVSRVPRLLAILCTGMGMSVAGLIMQQLCMNKFVSPTTGATIQSAQFGVLMAMVFVPSLGLVGRSLFAFVTAALGTWVFVWFIQRIKFKDVVMVPLVGIMFGYVITGVTSFIAFMFDMNQALDTWLVGHFSMVLEGRYELVLMVVPLVALAFAFANHFNIVGMGKDFSKNLGVHYNLVLVGGLTIAAFITASVVVTVGSISYIGLIVPNLVSMFKGDKIRGTLVDTALFGALFVLVCDLVARTVISPFELPIELIVGIVGSVVFIAMLMYRLSHGRKAIRVGRGTGGAGGTGAGDAPGTPAGPGAPLATAAGSPSACACVAAGETSPRAPLTAAPAHAAHAGPARTASPLSATITSSFEGSVS
ncbi:MAG: iron chelate uptake ABC transporter family permease subunit [Coriobacteriales bacterium]|jgi:iron complex transport system permease protein